jgi:hypothetical protein
MGEPHEDLQTLEAMKVELDSVLEKAERLGKGNGGGGGSIYQSVLAVNTVVGKEIEAVRRIVGPHQS